MILLIMYSAEPGTSGGGLNVSPRFSGGEGLRVVLAELGCIGREGQRGVGAFSQAVHVGLGHGVLDGDKTIWIGCITFKNIEHLILVGSFNNAVVHAVIRNAIIGEDCKICPGAVIGGSFPDGEGRKISVVGKAKTIEGNQYIKPGEIY